MNQGHTVCSYGYKAVFVCFDDRFSKPEQKYWDEDAMYKFISEMFQEAKYCKENKTKENESEKHFRKAKKMSYM